MAKFDTLYDAFGGASLDAQWNIIGGATVTVTSGYCNINDTAGGIETATTYDLSGSNLQFELNSGSEPDDIYITIGDAGMFAPTLKWHSGTWSAGFSSFAVPCTAGSYGNFASGTSGRKWARMIDVAGDTVFQDSADGSSWSTIHTYVFSPPSNHKCYINCIGAGTDYKFASVGVSGGGGGVLFRPYFVTG